MKWFSENSESCVCFRGLAMNTPLPQAPPLVGTYAFAQTQQEPNNKNDTDIRTNHC